MEETSSLPYYTVIFTSRLRKNAEGYAEMGRKMAELAQQQDGFLGMDSARNEVGITVSYWESLEAIQQWKQNLQHLHAQALGKAQWYEAYEVRVCKVEREYHFFG